MKITSEEIQYIAKLAKLDFTEEEAVVFAKEFDSILSHFDNLDREDYTNTDMRERENAISVFRDDEVQPFKDQEELFQNAKSKRESYLELPKIVE
ncbi:aspartyl/glutamyl-tRNA(Asn/Gln) amidotransferase subunit C [Anaerovirgula multivorans]|uniref:Aspartyl/glutamyl-tRNA(Asn/Gln) amidotransferase subunit C n=1 Tax=Anaerovirgula multivorans TaxID=312168 RepID=A0A239C0H4_9FIRM|nr:Asp-tRNA(Asn)/Glu-tRNA(Gln) amidotransferase subunit GatC [Anaerovirgula multivorans]SNS12883.1 aspartyl/glutamyl-tRNA(Asn/Gln) amidotransferase subunit C [Anaerovirgula multivorans]